MDKKAIIKGIESVARRGAKLQDDIQKLGLAIIQHVEEHRDSTLADQLFGAMPAGTRRVMLADWFCAFGKLRVLDKRDEEDAKRIKEHGHHFAYDRERSTDMDGAAETKWYEMRKAQAATEAYDAQASIKRIMARIAKGGLADTAAAIRAAKELVATLEQMELPSEVVAK